MEGEIRRYFNRASRQKKWHLCLVSVVMNLLCGLSSFSVSFAVNGALRLGDDLACMHARTYISCSLNTSFGLCVNLLIRLLLIMLMSSVLIGNYCMYMNANGDY